MKHHSEVINHIIEKKGFKSYLEIGIHNRASNFDRVKCKFKIGVDPDPRCMANFQGTSDEWFYDSLINFDIIFIDGLHTWQQVKQDLENAIACLNSGGIILLHDTSPHDERFTHVPRDVKGRWNGDVYKMLPMLKDMKYCTIDLDGNGLTIVKPGVAAEFEPLTWQEFVSNKAEHTRPTTVEKLKLWI